MYIKFDKNNEQFTLTTLNTKYVIKVCFGKYLKHVFYGAKDQDIPSQKEIIRDFAPYREDLGKCFSLDTEKLEFSYYGSGDLRTSSLKLKNKNGDSVTFFEYENYKIVSGVHKIEKLPHARAADTDNIQTLIIILKDSLTNCRLYLYYTVFYDCDIIARHFRLENDGDNDVLIERAMSLTLDLPQNSYDMITLSGTYGHECNYERAKLTSGNRSVFSRNGCTGHRFNPFVAVCECDTTELSGKAYGINLIYSGDFLSEAELSGDKLRLQTGVNPDTFCYTLLEGQAFTSPQAVLSFSSQGLSRLSNNFHNFILNHIIDKTKAFNKAVVLNSWEARFFDIDEDLLLSFADECVKTGIDLLVMDDGWFGRRNDDNSSLGDWYEDTSKFKDGLKNFVRKIQEKGIGFGIWVEPEMISPDSQLFKSHPNWVFGAKSRKKSLSRNQLCIDMANPDVVEYLKTRFLKTFDGIKLDYIKWDFNRYITEPGSPSLKDYEQGVASFKFMKGSYELLNWFNNMWPHALLETCSGGGGRFDLGMMYYSSQIWSSDNTSPESRIKIQHGISFAYPAAVMSCHVTNFKGIIADFNELDFRYKVAAGGVLGYELDITKVDINYKQKIKQQINNYKKFRDIILHGEITRINCPHKDKVYSYYYKYKNEYVLYCLPLQSNIKIKLPIDKIDTEKQFIEVFVGKRYSGEQLFDGININTQEKIAHLFYFVQADSKI